MQTALLSKPGIQTVWERYYLLKEQFKILQQKDNIGTNFNCFKLLTLDSYFACKAPFIGSY